jgi:hypothetical protein
MVTMLSFRSWIVVGVGGSLLSFEFEILKNAHMC